MKATIALLSAALILTGCMTLGRYTGNEYYYTQEGVRWSCRDPQPYLGGNCKPYDQWPDKGLN